MPVTDADLSAKGREVEQKFVEKWIELEVPAFVLMGQEEADIRGAVEEGFSGTGELFELWNGRDPDGLQDMRDQLNKTVQTFSNIVMADLDTAKTELTDWQGSAARDFATWMGRMDQVSQNQVALIQVLDKALEMVQALSTGTRNEAIAIGDGTIEILDGLENSDDGGFGFGAALLAAVATVVAGAVTFGAGSVVVGTFTVIAGSASFAGAVNEEVQRRDAMIQGDDVIAVFTSMGNAISALYDIEQEQAQAIADAVSADEKVVLDNSAWFEQPRPELVSLDVGNGITPEVEDAFEPPRA